MKVSFNPAGTPVRCIALALFGLALSAQADNGYAQQERPTVEQAIERHLQAVDSGLIVNAAAQRVAGLQAFYAARDFRPVWVADGKPTEAALALRDVLAGADRDGLDPDAYDAGEFSPSNPFTTARYEVAHSAAALRYANDLAYGRAAPSESDPDLFVAPQSLDGTATLEKLASSADIAATLESYVPVQPQYRALREALAALRTETAEAPMARLADSGKLELGNKGPEVIVLRDLLRNDGADLPVGPDDAIFDAGLRDAVMTFQKRNGLDADGIVGKATRTALNVTRADRTRQLIVNMERWRWLPGDLGRRHIIVNIAGFALDAVADGQVRQHMKVVVGRTYRRTPVFSGLMTYLEINPYWHVPPKIAGNDLLPKIRQSVSYLETDGFRVFSGWGANAAELDPKTIDWSAVSVKRFPYKLRQDPGPKNALGQIKFMFPNRYDVYLHDTPSRELFARTVRVFSSGCIRVERPRDLALFVLDETPEWTPEALAAAFEGKSTQKIPLRKPLPVHLTYQTAWVDSDGTVQYRSDVYERDAALAGLLFRQR